MKKTNKKTETAIDRIDSIESLISLLKEKRPARWEEIPDIDLYMDQVISIMERQHIGIGIGENLTSSMINNYIKSEIMPRAIGKRYNREHIAYLTIICLLKQVMPIKEIGILLESLTKEKKLSVERTYELYCHILDGNLLKQAKELEINFTFKDEREAEKNEVSSERKGDEQSDNIELIDAKMFDINALKLAISSYCERFVCLKLIEMNFFKDDSEKL